MTWRRSPWGRPVCPPAGAGAWWAGRASLALVASAIMPRVRLRTRGLPDDGLHSSPPAWWGQR